MKSIIQEAIESFNKHHGIEAQLALEHWVKNKLTLKFSGHMCFTCGVNDYVDDFIFDAADKGITLKVLKNEIQKNAILVTCTLQKK